MNPITADDIAAAAVAIGSSIAHTPSSVSQTLSELLGCTVVLKFENFQFTASFKERGAANKLLQLTDEERARGVITVSAGNHAQAVARHGSLLGIDVLVVMPEPTPFVKVANTRALGAHVELSGLTVAEAFERGAELAAEQGRTFVHPFDDPWVIAGQGTLGLELLADHPELDTLVVPVGGGGLLSGLSILYRDKAPDVELVGVQSELYPSMVRALAGDERVCPGGQTMAEGIAVSKAGSLTSAILRDARVEMLTVSERSIEEAVNLLLEIEKVVAEGAGAAGLAAIAEHRARFAGRTVGIVVTGGNIDPRLLSSTILRGLVHSGRLSRLRVWLDDRPGSLSLVTGVIGRMGANIVEVVHQRLFGAAPIHRTEVELAIETMDRAHADRVIAALEDNGYRVATVSIDENS
jgi:threonine dehydratase